MIKINGTLVYKKGYKKAEVHEGEYFCAGKWVVYFYYNGFINHEAYGTNGCGCKIFDTRQQSINSARYYVNKESCN